MSLFDFQSFVDELRDHETKHVAIENYECSCGSLADKDICETDFYANYLSKFHMDFRIESPEELGNDFDWPLLMKLVAGSFSSDYVLKLSDGWKKNPTHTITAKLIIMVHHDNYDKGMPKSAVKSLNDLWSFQVLRLYEIYCEEQMNLTTLTDEDPYTIEKERWLRLALFNIRVEALKSEAELYLKRVGKKLNVIDDTTEDNSQ